MVFTHIALIQKWYNCKANSSCQTRRTFQYICTIRQTSCCEYIKCCLLISLINV